MKRLCVASCLLITALLVSGASAQTNLLNNPGFDDALGFDFSDTSNWNGFFGGPAGVFLEAFNDTGAPALAGNALELTIQGEMGVTNGFESFTGHVQTVTGVAGGDLVDYSVFARNNDSGLTGLVEFRLEFRDGMGEISRTQIELSGLTDEYQPFLLQATAPAGTTEVNAVIAVSTFNQDVLHDHSVLFDNASLTVVPEPASLAIVAIGLVGVVASRRRAG